MKRLYMVLLAVLICQPAFAQVKTTVADKLLLPDGTPVTGTLKITAAQTFQAADGFNVLAGGVKIVTLGADGSFTVALIPNAGSSPTSSYRVQYVANGTVVAQTWSVPVSASPVGLLTVWTPITVPLSAGGDAATLGGHLPAYFQLALGFTPVPNTRQVAGKALSADITLNSTDLGDASTINAATLGTHAASYFQIVLGSTIDASTMAGVDMGDKVNAAWAALPSTGGRINVPGGDFFFATPIVLGDGSSYKTAVLAGVGTAPTVLHYTPTTGDAITLNFQHGSAVASSGGLEDFTLIGPGSGSGDGIVLISNSNGVYKNVLVENFGNDGWHIDSSTGDVVNNDESIFEQVQSHLNGRYGLYAAGLDSNVLHIIGGSAYCNDLGGYYFDAASNEDVFEMPDGSYNGPTCGASGTAYGFTINGADATGNVFGEENVTGAVHFGSASFANKIDIMSPQPVQDDSTAPVHNPYRHALGGGDTGWQNYPVSSILPPAGTLNIIGALTVNDLPVAMPYGPNQLNLIPDSDLKFGPSFWSIGGFSIVAGAGGGGGNAFVATGTGSPVSIGYVQSSAIAVVPGQTYTFSGYVDATAVSSGTIQLALGNAGLSAAYCSVQQPNGSSGRIACSYTVGAGIYTMNTFIWPYSTTTMPNGSKLIASDFQLEIGSTVTPYKSSYPPSGGFTNPMATLGSLIYGGAAGAATELTGPTAVASVPQILTSTPSGGAATAPAWVPMGVPVNAQTGTTYTVVATDRGKYLSLSNGSSIAVTLPQAGTTGFASGFSFVACDIGVGTATITPTTSTISYSNRAGYTSAAGSLALGSGQCATVYTDGANYFAVSALSGIIPTNQIATGFGTVSNTTFAMGLNRGSNLAPAFAAAYTIGGSGCVETGGAMTCTSTSGSANFYPTTSLTPVATDTYQVDLNVSAWTAGTIGGSFCGVSFQTMAPAGAADVRVFAACSSAAALTVSVANSSTMTFSSVTVKRVAYDSTSLANVNIIIDQNTGLTVPLIVYMPPALAGWTFQEMVRAFYTVVLKTANGTDTWNWGCTGSVPGVSACTAATTYQTSFTLIGVSGSFITWASYANGYWDYSGVNGNWSPL